MVVTRLFPFMSGVVLKFTKVWRELLVETQGPVHLGTVGSGAGTRDTGTVEQS